MTTAIQRKAVSLLNALDFLDGFDVDTVSRMRDQCGGDPRAAASELGYESENCARLRREAEAAFARLEVNGVMYDSEAEAEAVRSALAAAGLPNHYPGNPEAVRALRAARVLQTPAIGRRFGCGCEQGVIVAIAGDRVTIRQDIRGGIVAVGSEFTLPLHVVSPATVPAGGAYPY